MLVGYHIGFHNSAKPMQVLLVEISLVEIGLISSRVILRAGLHIEI